MKAKTNLRLLVLIVTAVMMFPFVFGCGRSVQISTVESFHYSYRGGMEADSNDVYDIELIDGEYRAKIKPSGVSDEDALEISIEELDVRALEEIMCTYNVGSWDGFDKSNSFVMDGNSFTLKVDMDGGRSINAHGYANFPNDFYKFSDEIDRVFMRIYNDNYSDT